MSKLLTPARGHAVPPAYDLQVFLSGLKVFFFALLLGIGGISVGYLVAGAVVLFHLAVAIHLRLRLWAWTKGGPIPTTIVNAWGREIHTLCRRTKAGWVATYYLVKNDQGEWIIYNTEGIDVQIIQTLETAKRYTLARAKKENQ